MYNWHWTVDTRVAGARDCTEQRAELVCRGRSGLIMGRCVPTVLTLVLIVTVCTAQLSSRVG